jgi:hypothetical protein
MPIDTQLHRQSALVALDAARRELHRDNEQTHLTLAIIGVAEAALAIADELASSARAAGRP